MLHRITEQKITSVSVIALAIGAILLNNTGHYEMVNNRVQYIFGNSYPHLFLLLISVASWIFLAGKFFHNSIFPSIVKLMLVITLVIGGLFTFEAMQYHPTTVMSMVRMAFNPMFYIIFFAMTISSDDELFGKILLLDKVFVFVFVILCLLELSNSKYSILPFGLSPLMNYRKYAFWGIMFYICAKDELSMKEYILLFAALIFCTYVSAVIISRSLIIQGVIGMLVLNYYHLRASKYKIWILFFIAIFFLFIIPYIIQLFVTSSSFEFLMNKMGNDSRSFQYKQVFEYFSTTDFLIGKGAFAQWLQNNRMYSYIDNVTVLSLYRYGLFPTVTYYVLLLLPAIIYFFRYQKVKLAWFVFMWCMGINGLAVYNALDWDFANLLAVLAAGRCWSSLYMPKSVLLEYQE